MSVRPIRVLHVVEQMNRAGVETWLMHVLRKMNRRQIAMDFLVHRAGEGHFDAELLSLGARRYVCPCPRRPWQYASNFRAVINLHGPFDVVHSHVDHFTGAVMKIAKWLRIQRRVAHSHNDTRLQQAGAGILRSGYFQLMNHWIQQDSTDRLAASQRAAMAMFSGDWQLDARCRVLPYGLDWSAFAVAHDQRTVRAELGIPQEAWVIGHVGRFEEQKNHALIIRIFAGVCERVNNAHLLLVGDGPLRPSIERSALAMGIKPRITFASVRTDVARLMNGAMDCFLFPSVYEGLGIAALEAQAAGLPCVLSEVVPEEVAVAPSLPRRVSLAAPLAAWIEALMSTRHQPRLHDAVRHLRDSVFSIESSCRALAEVYS